MNTQNINLNKISDPNVEKIVQEYLKLQQLGRNTQMILEDHIKSLVESITEVVRLNQINININSKLSANKSAELFQDYQVSKANLNKIMNELTSNQNNVPARNLFNLKKELNEIIVQKLVSEVYNLGTLVYKIYQHNNIFGPTPTVATS